MAYLDNFHNSVGATTQMERAISTLFFISAVYECFLPNLETAIWNEMKEGEEPQLIDCRSDIEEFITKDESDDIKLFIDYLYGPLGIDIEDHTIIGGGIVKTKKELNLKYDLAMPKVIEHLRNNKFPNEIVYGDYGEKYDLTDKIWQDAVQFCIGKDKQE